MSVSTLNCCARLLIRSLFKYPICHPSWTDFLCRSEAMVPSSVVTHFSETYRLNPPTLAPAAILAFLTLALHMLHPAQANYATQYSFQSPASLSLTMRRSEDWDTDWYRCINLGQSDRRRAFSETYVLGSLEGVWEGIFSVSAWTLFCLINRSSNSFLFQYTEFASYSLLLSGGAPPVLDQCLTAHHRQAWKLREYYLAEDQESSREKSRSLGSGDPLKAHFPAGTRFQEFIDFVEVQEPGRDVVHYWRPSHTKPDGHNVMDIIILGEVLPFLFVGGGFS